MTQRVPRKNKTPRKGTPAVQISVKPETDSPAFADQLQALYQKNLPRGTNVDVIYATIREAIRGGQVRSGTHLTELDLAAALRVSRTPIREALQKLESEYLLDKSPRRGFVVPTLGLNDIVEIFEIREALLGLAARCAAQHANAAELALMAETIIRMERAQATNDSGGLSQASAQFHRVIEQASKNQRLQKLIRLNSGAMPLYEFADPERFEPAIAEHRAIYEAIAAHDVERAERLAQEHSRNALQALTRTKDLNGDGLGDP